MKKKMLFVVLACAVVAGFAEWRTGASRRAVFNRDFFGGEYNHFLPCSKLPTEAEVQRVLRQHRDVVDKIGNIRFARQGPDGKARMLGPMMHVSFGNGEEYGPDVAGVYNKIRLVAPASSEKCPGKADIYIEFGGISDSVMLKEIIGGDTFFGIPYRMHNI